MASRIHVVSVIDLSYILLNLNIMTYSGAGSDAVRDDVLNIA